MKKTINCVALASLFSLSSIAQAVTIEHVFSANTAAKAEEVNQNFADLAEAINALSSSGATSMNVDCSSDSSALETAITQINQGSGYLEVSITGDCNGEFELTRSNVHFSGDGQNSTISAVGLNESEAMIIKGAQNISFKDLTVDVAGTDAIALIAWQGAAVTLKNVTFLPSATDSDSDGIGSFAGVEAGYSSTIRAENIQGDKVVFLASYGSSLDVRNPPVGAFVDAEYNSMVQMRGSNSIAEMFIAYNSSFRIKEYSGTIGFLDMMHASGNVRNVDIDKSFIERSFVVFRNTDINNLEISNSEILLEGDSDITNLNGWGYASKVILFDSEGSVTNCAGDIHDTWNESAETPIDACSNTNQDN